MARDPIILPGNVKMETTFPAPISTIGVPEASNAGTPTAVRFKFRPADKAVVTMRGSVQSGLFAADDRRLCGLEFMQFATPTRLVREYVGVLQGSTTFDYAGHIRNHEFLDTPTDPTATALVARRGPFMSGTPHKASLTRDGHFINDMEDHPGFGTPDFLVAEDGERHFLLRVSYVANFVTLLVFLHPSGRRQPVALVRWTVNYDFSTRWRGGRLTTIIGRAAMTAGNVSTVPESLADFTARVNNPPRFVINQVINPSLMTGLANPLPDANQRFFFPLRHPAADGDFWAP